MTSQLNLFAVLTKLDHTIQEYPTLLGAIAASAKAHWVVTDSTCLVLSELTAKEIRDSISSAVEDTAMVFVLPSDMIEAHWTPMGSNRYGREFVKQAFIAAEQSRNSNRRPI
ncbi:MAG: hypothetical protein MK036_04170 [Dehalococcoidia bacterium]|jgi:hypothetical protein|nr:hypothetical protein [Dehalococcoidia bacterium]|tara:strand:- start:911 stop:1246 length:336 start_codon:yes stop_codon:yes gene_type:complete